MEWAYFFALGFENMAIRSLFLDFFILVTVSIYFLHYRNPLLRKSIKKISWTMTSKDYDRKSGVDRAKINERKLDLKELLERYTDILAL